MFFKSGSKISNEKLEIKQAAVNIKKPGKRFLDLIFSSKSVPPQVISDFFDQLTTLLASGIPLLQALEFTRSATRHAILKEALVDISAKIRTGVQFSEALSLHANIFDRVVMGMIRSAEASGHLENICLELAKSYQAQAEMRGRLFQALAYPTLVASVGVITVGVLLTFVVPKLTAIFDLWDTQLPLVTRVLLGVSNFMSHGGFLAFILLIVGLIALLRMVKPEKRNQIAFKLSVTIPFAKRLFFLSDFVRLTRTWGMLLKSGVPLIDAIRASKEVLWNPDMRSSLDELRETTLRGTALREAIREAKWFPELAQSFLSVGETTGTLDQSFEKIAAFYEREFDRKIRIMSTFLEPLLILAIGLVVGFLVISLLLPIFEMSLVVR